MHITKQKEKCQQSLLTDVRLVEIELRFREINRKLEQLRETGVCPIVGVDPEFYQGQLLEELDEIEYGLGMAGFSK